MMNMVRTNWNMCCVVVSSKKFDIDYSVKNNKKVFWMYSIILWAHQRESKITKVKLQLEAQLQVKELLFLDSLQEEM